MQRRALVVDDEPIVCQMIEKILKSAGIEALTLTRSTEAPEILDEGMFDVVFLDLHMPYPDGIDLARQMRTSRFNRLTPIIMLSDDQRPSALSVGFAAGASFFLYKPIDKDRLLKLVRATQGAMEHERAGPAAFPFSPKLASSLARKNWKAKPLTSAWADSWCTPLVSCPWGRPCG